MVLPELNGGASAGLRRRIVYAILAGLALAVASVVGLRLVEPALAPSVDMTSIQGERLRLADLRGQVVLLSFWATDCAICLQEMPAMAETYRRYRPRGLEAIFVAMPHDRPDRVLHYARRNDLPFKVALDVQGRITRAFGDVQATPATFVIDKKGRIVDKILGEPDFERLRRFIERKLDEPA